MNRFKLLLIGAVLIMAPVIVQANEDFVETIRTVTSAIVVVTSESPAPNSTKVIIEFGEDLEEFGFPEGFLDNLIPKEGPSADNDAPERKAYSFGTGFFIENYIVTNHHVIDNAEKIVIHFENHPTRYEVEVVSSDEIADIAVLQLKEHLPFDVTPLEWSEVPLSLGQEVWAIGHPRGLEYSVTKGIISSTHRTASNNWQISVQTDAAVNQGNSGGPLLDMDGNVVAINTVIVTSGGGSNGLSVSVESEYAQTVITKLLSGEAIDRPLMGIMIGENIMTGEIFAARVGKGSAAEAAGVKADDHFVSLDGQPIAYAQDVYEVLRTHQPGDTIEGIFDRDGTAVMVHITFASMNEAHAAEEAAKK